MFQSPHPYNHPQTRGAYTLGLGSGFGVQGLGYPRVILKLGSLDSLQWVIHGIIQGTTIGVIKGDTKSSNLSPY